MQIDNSKIGLGHVVSWVSLVITLVASWGVFYSEQKINSVKLQSQSEIIRSHTRAINNLTENQAKMVTTISNNTANIEEIKRSLKDVSSTVKESREYLIRISEKVGVNDKRD